VSCGGVACLGAVVGLAIERTILRARLPAFRRPADLWILSAGASPERAETLADTLISRGATALLSFGIAGGLDPAVRPGAVVLADEIILPDGTRLGADIAWADRVAAAARDMTPHRAPIAGTARMLTSADQKSELRRRTGAVAADMESHGVARAAAACGVPFLVLRVIADPAGRAIPWSALAGMGEDGTMRAWPVLGRLLRHPWEIAALARLARDSRQAHAALGRVALRCAAALAG